MTHLGEDVNMTTKKLRSYLNGGVEHVDEKVAVLEERVRKPPSLLAAMSFPDASLTFLQR